MSGRIVIAFLVAYMIWVINLVFSKGEDVIEQSRFEKTEMNRTDLAERPPTELRPATTSVDASTTSDDASTASDDASTASDAPSTTTGVASSTTIGDDMTGVTTMTTTTNETTGGPPSKDPQPVAGLYEACLDNTPCDLSTDGCFTLAEVNMIVTDGFCTLFCDSVVDCGTKPQCPAVQECLSISVDQKVCALKCAGANDCPTGMFCTVITLSMGQTGTYCF